MRKMCCFIACFCSSKSRRNKSHPDTQLPLQIHDDASGKLEQLNPSIQNDVRLKSDAKETEEKVHECVAFVTEYCQENRGKEESQTASDSSVSSYISYPPFYKHIVDNNDCDDGEFQDVNSKLDQESSESLFSLSIDSRKQVNVSESEEKEEVSSALRIRSILNPNENANQEERVVISKTVPLTLKHPEDDQKENLNAEQELKCEEPSLIPSSPKQTFSNPRPKVPKKEVDTSLSSWLVESPVSEDSLNSRQTERRIRSCTSFEKRQVLGELDVGNVKQLSANSISKDEATVLGASSRKANSFSSTQALPIPFSLPVLNSK